MVTPHFIISTYKLNKRKWGHVVGVKKQTCEDFCGV
jgi:hypothetical protein